MMLEKINVLDHIIQIQKINSKDFQSNKPVLVFLHEALGSIAQWKTFPQELCRRLNLPALLYDRIGSGGSDSISTPRRKGYLEEQAYEFLPEILEQLGIKKVILIGHSDGASIALLYAAKFQDKTLLTVSEAAHVFVEPVGLEGLKRAREAYLNGPVKKLLERYHGAKTDALFWAWYNTWSSEDYRDWSMEQYIPSITCPVLVIQGENDEYATLEQVHRVSKKTAGVCEEYIVPECAHIPHLQSGKAVLEKIAVFIESHLPDYRNS